MKPWLKILIVIIILIICFCLVKKGCHSNPEPAPYKDSSAFFPPYIDSQLIVWRKSSATDAGWRAKTDAFIAKYGNEFTVELCKNCDSNLQIWKGGAVDAYISSEIKPGSKTGTKPSGEDSISYYSLNFNVNLPANDSINSYDTTLTLTPPVDNPFRSNRNKLTVAVFDTGLDSAITKTFSADTVESCQGDEGKHGWNFVADNNDVTDDHPWRHGSVVTSFITEQVKTGDTLGRRPVHILPVKIFDRRGSADLFKILCAFAYAKNAGADIINASFGFYYAVDSSMEQVPLLLLEYVRETLTENNIILVAAAGNADTEADNLALQLGISTADLRNLDKHHFYPASLSDSLRNVICITTVNALDGVSPRQNHSNRIADAGAESEVPNQDLFRNPFYGTRTDAPVVAGSSFATPIFTGKLCRWYNQVVTAPPVNKSNIMTELKRVGVIHNDRTVLNSQIVTGNYIKRNGP